MKEIDFNQLQNINGIYYEIDTQIPFTGKSKRYYESDDCDGYREITYRNGLEDGPFKTYDEDGLLLFEGSYKNGLEEGPYKKYYENGGVEKEGRKL